MMRDYPDPKRPRSGQKPRGERQLSWLADSARGDLACSSKKDNQEPAR